MTTLESILPLATAQGLPTVGPFAAPSACLAELRRRDPDALDAERWAAVTTEAGILLVGNDGQGLPPEVERRSLAQLTDKREKGELLTKLRAIDLGKSEVLFDVENLAWFPSPGAAEGWLLRRRNRRDDALALRRFGLWVGNGGDRGVAVFSPNEDAMLVASMRLRMKGVIARRIEDFYARHQLPMPRALPPFDPAAAAELAAMLQETTPGPRRSLANYLAYLGPVRCFAFARLAVELAAHPEWEMAHVQGLLTEIGLVATDDGETVAIEDPRVGSNGPRSVGGICFRLLARWVGRRLAGWIEHQG